jgi:hypothetical protein
VSRNYTLDEAAGLAARWLQAFGARRQGVNTRAYLWHVFSANRYPSIAGDQALLRYASLESPEYIVLSNDRQSAWATQRRPLKAGLSDWLVFPPNLAWTVAFTHEDGWLGPYLALHQDFAKLDADNLAQLRKAREAAAAKARGWS